MISFSGEVRLMVELALSKGVASWCLEFRLAHSHEEGTDSGESPTNSDIKSIWYSGKQQATQIQNTVRTDVHKPHVNIIMHHTTCF